MMCVRVCVCARVSESSEQGRFCHGRELRVETPSYRARSLLRAFPGSPAPVVHAASKCGRTHLHSDAEEVDRGRSRTIKPINSDQNKNQSSGALWRATVAGGGGVPGFFARILWVDVTLCARVLCCCGPITVDYSARVSRFFELAQPPPPCHQHTTAAPSARDQTPEPLEPRA
jgi:hypothetical protein